MKKRWIAAAALMCSANCMAESIDAPAVKAGDEWSYVETIEKAPNGWKQEHEELTVTRVTPKSIYFTARQSGSTQPGKDLIAGADWSRSRDIGGTETVVAQPLSFPLSAGKNWQLAYTQDHPNPQHQSEHFDNRFTVVGYESVTVTAGTFKALKIEAEGTWTAEIAAGQTVVQAGHTDANGASLGSTVKKTEARTTSGRLYRAFWYAPEVKRWVKSIEEDYGSNGTRNQRITGELESFKLAD